MVQFKKAVKYEAKGRVSLVGPAGSGKSYTMLTLARAMVGPEGRIAAIDTEHGSLSKYADLFDFDVMELDSFSPLTFIEAINVAAQAGYNAFCCDSLSHFWMGKDGALEFVDMAQKRHKDNMGGWKEFRPQERAMVEAILAAPMHVLTTMRTKTDYQDQINPNTGKKQRVKIGLAPVQREGMEYEFDLVGYMDEENTLNVDKTRCPAYSQKALAKPSAKDFAPFVEWLKGSAVPVTAPAPAPSQPVTAKRPIESVVLRPETITESVGKNNAPVWAITDIDGVVYYTTNKQYADLLGFTQKAHAAVPIKFQMCTRDGQLVPVVVDVEMKKEATANPS